MVYTRHGIITALFVASACTAEPHPLAQALLHRGGIDVSVTGEGLDDFIAGTGIQLVPEGTYYVETVDSADETVRARQSPHEAYAFDVRIEDWILWRYRDKVPYSEVAIDRDSVEPDWPEGQGIGPVQTLGWVPATGQWMGEVLIHLEDQAPWDICVELTSPDNETLDGGRLLNGRIGYYPGDGRTGTTASPDVFSRCGCESGVLHRTHRLFFGFGLEYSLAERMESY